MIHQSATGVEGLAYSPTLSSSSGAHKRKQAVRSVMAWRHSKTIRYTGLPSFPGIRGSCEHTCESRVFVRGGSCSRGSGSYERRTGERVGRQIRPGSRNTPTTTGPERQPLRLRYQNSGSVTDMRAPFCPFSDPNRSGRLPVPVAEHSRSQHVR